MSGSETKKELRKRYLKAREHLPVDDRKRWSAAIFQVLITLECFEESRTVFCYMDFRGEVETEPIIRYCLQKGKRVALPRISERADGEKTMQAIEVRDPEADLAVGGFGIREPKAELDREILPWEIDLVIVPGIVFDQRGFRIGYGAGYYDAFLKHVSHQCVKMGLAYEMQMVNAIPADPHDISMDMVITERRIITKKYGQNERMKV